MKKNSVILTASVATLVVGIGGYMLYDYFVGNHVEIQPAAAATTASATASSTPLTADQLNKKWTINDQSKVYFSVTTSKETVNFEMDGITGSWDVNLTAPDQMKATASADLNKLNSGNEKRDTHIKSPDYFDTAVHPAATFEAKSFENWPSTWTEGQKASFTINGVLTVRGIAKDVKINADAIYSQGKLQLEGTSVVTFGDFGLNSPHTIVAKTEENITITLRLALDAV
ncbi:MULTISPECIES: YceI family protein [Brevibacillus]|uniref:YceI family protein n=1 Tax=Brevibacillus TaxID=55080 RepID=UPI000D0F5B9B|nr:MULTISPECIES: YceI family protein [Brevibacillus]MED1947933.1 YceI family protein [Brevibacillus formosus]MED1998336.1 YceI family protein [Brevibacillus formosus]MED2080877.1 YceI family protein [Brevibacillus formosus]PSK20458.1 YceI family protein [Brevibacillus sp. NRRL NRS-603]